MPDNSFKDITLSDFRGKKVVLFFYPLDFTYVWPTELIAFDRRLGEFEKRNVQVLGCSVDSQFSHLRWKEMEINGKKWKVPVVICTGLRLFEVATRSRRHRNRNAPRTLDCVVLVYLFIIFFFNLFIQLYINIYISDWKVHFERFIRPFQNLINWWFYEGFQLKSHDHFFTFWSSDPTRPVVPKNDPKKRQFSLVEDEKMRF